MSPSRTPANISKTPANISKTSANISQNPANISKTPAPDYTDQDFNHRDDHIMVMMTRSQGGDQYKFDVGDENQPDVS